MNTNQQVYISFWEDSYCRLKKNKLAMLGLSTLLALIILSIIIPIFSTHKYYEANLPMKNLSPSIESPFGTDELGRSMFVRIWIGTRISLLIGISAALIDMIIGVLYGGLAGLIGGKTEEIMMRITDIISSIPNLLIIILLLVVMRQGIFTIIITIAITGWVGMARIIRGQILSIKEQNFIHAARGLGANNFRILTRHLIPNCFGSIITIVTFTIPHAIFTEAFLSFLGLGVQVPMASLGVMAKDGLSAISFYPYRLFFPAAFISIIMLSFNLLGDGLRDAFDSRLSK